MSLAQRVLGCDTRSLALARILLAAALIAHSASGVSAAPFVLRALAVLAGAMLLVGWRTFAAAAVGYLSLIGGYLSADFQGVDPLLVVMLLLAPFLPLAAQLSVDAALDTANAAVGGATPPPPTATTVVSVASFALSAQIVLVLFASAESAFLGGGSLRQAGALNTLAITSPLLIFLPLPGGVVRTLAILALLAGITVAMPALAGAVGKLTLCAGLTALLPATLWDTLARIPRLAPPRDLAMYYDRDCGFCRKICFIFRALFALGDTPVTPAQDDAQIGTVMARDNTWVITDAHADRHTRWRGVLFVLRRSPLCWPLGYALTWLGMGIWGDPLYAAIAASRGHLSRLTAHLLPYRRERPLGGTTASAAVGTWLALMLLFGFVHVFAWIEPGSTLDKAARALGLAQSWNLW